MSILGLFQTLKSSVEVALVGQSNLILDVMNYADAVTIFISITGKEKLLLNNELQSLFMLLFTLQVMRKAGGDIRT